MTGRSVETLASRAGAAVLCASVAAFTSAWSAGAAHAADVEITANTATVDLDTLTGATARIAPGVTVSSGVTATVQPWAVTNEGTVNGSNAIVLRPGGSVTNAAGASIGSTFSGIIFGLSGAGGGPGTVDNFGTIVGGIGEGVTLLDGGIVTNHQGATISTATGLNAVSVGQGTSRSVVNHGTISSTRTTGFSTGVLMQGGAASLTNTATGTIFGDYNGVYTSGSVNLTMTNHGHISSTRGPAVEVDGGGGTLTNTGTIEAPATGTTAALRFSGTGTVTNSGTIRSNAGTRAISFFGNVTHTLILQTGSVIGGEVRGNTGTDNLILQGIGTESIAKFISFETVTMQGSDWTLTGNGTFATSATVQSGRLVVEGQLTSPAITVAAPGTLAGTGILIGNVTNNGTIAPGNSIGTLTITGNYTQAGGSIYNVELNTALASDLIHITGTATIASGAAVHVLPAAGLYRVGDRYRILTALGGVTGTYDTLTDNAPFVDFQLAYDANNVYLDVTSSMVSFRQIAQTSNQSAAAGAAERLGAGNAVFDAILMQTTAGALRAFDLLSGEIHASLHGTMLEDSRFLREAVTERLRQSPGGTLFASTVAAFAVPEDGDGSLLPYAARKKRSPARAAIDKAASRPAPPPARDFAAWAHAFGNWGHVQGDGNAAPLDRTTGGFIAGIDRTFGDPLGIPWRAGIAAGAQFSSFNIAGRLSSASVETVHVAAYGGTHLGALALRAGLAQAWHSVATTRTVAFPGFADTLKADYDARTTQLFADIGYALPLGPIATEPFLSLAHVNVRADGFRETGGAAALAAPASSESASFSTLGLRAGMPVSLANGWAARINAAVGWRHAFNSGAPVRTMAFAAGAADPFGVAGLPLAADAIALETGIDIAVDAHTRLGLTYSGQIAGSAEDHAVKGRAIRRF